MGLFNRKKKDDANPYADAAPAPFTNPMTPYQQVRNNVAQGQPASIGLPGKNPRLNSVASAAPGTPPPPYKSGAPSVAGTSGGYGDDKYGNQSGYGSNRYDNAPRAANTGYGGFDADAGKSDLFGNASGRYVAPQQNAAAAPPAAGPGASRYGNNDPNKSALLGNAQDRYTPYGGRPQPQAGDEDDEFGGYGAPRELTGR